MIAETSEHTHAVWCDQCGNILDPGAVEAPHGGYQTEAEAIDAALTHGWLIDIFTPGLDRCADCAREALQ